MAWGNLLLAAYRIRLQLLSIYLCDFNKSKLMYYNYRLETQHSDTDPKYVKKYSNNRWTQNFPSHSGI